MLRSTSATPWYSFFGGTNSSIRRFGGSAPGESWTARDRRSCGEGAWLAFADTGLLVGGSRSASLGIWFAGIARTRMQRHRVDRIWTAATRLFQYWRPRSRCAASMRRTLLFCLGLQSLASLVRLFASVGFSPKLINARAMEVRLQPSLSAPDLTDLLEARRLASEDVLADSQTDNHRHQRKHVTPTTVQARDGGDDDDQDDICEHRSPEPTADIPWPAHRLPTPADSRSPSPSDDTDEPYHLRTRSESPEVFRRSPRSDRFHRTQSTRSRTDLQGSDVASEPAGMAGETSQMSSIERKQESLSVPPPLRPGPSRAPSSRPVVMPGSVPLPHEQANLSERILPASLWDYLQEELRASELDGSQELKAERVTNFFAVPMAVEKVGRC